MQAYHPNTHIIQPTHVYTHILVSFLPFHFPCCVLFFFIFFPLSFQLSFGWFFGQPIESTTLPSSLTSLLVSSNVPVERLVLPSALTSLRLEQHFAQPLENLRLNEGLRVLHFECSCIAPYPFPVSALRLPSTLLQLHLPRLCHPATGLLLPPSLRCLTYGYDSHERDPFLSVQLPADIELTRNVYGSSDPE